MDAGPHEPRGERRRRLVPAALALVALLALAALASWGRPLGIGRGGQGPSAGFVDYGWTTFLIVAVAWIGAAIWYTFSERAAKAPAPERGRWWIALPLYVAFVCLLVLAFHALHLTPHHGPRPTSGGNPSNANAGLLHRHPGRPAHTATFRWDEVVAIAVLLALVVLYLRARRSGALRRLPELGRRERAVALSAELDEAVDDLRNEPDVRRAIIAAYARTERALAAHGLPRRRAEAPLEYLARTLAELDASGASIRRLTDLFEVAKFSHHDLRSPHRDEAIDALLAVRDELREPVAA